MSQPNITYLLMYNSSSEDVGMRQIYDYFVRVTFEPDEMTKNDSRLK